MRFPEEKAATLLFRFGQGENDPVLGEVSGKWLSTVGDSQLGDWVAVPGRAVYF